MKTVAYRSFVIRVWCRQGQTARAVLEEIQTGTRSELRGERVERLVAVLDESLTPDPGESAEAVAKPLSEVGAPGRDQ